MAQAKDMYQCQVHYCGYVYDPDVGDPKRNIPPGTQFENLPDSWSCPFCGAHKHMFKPLAGPGSVLWENVRHHGGAAAKSDEEIDKMVASGDVKIKQPTAGVYQSHSEGAPADH